MVMIVAPCAPPCKANAAIAIPGTSFPPPIPYSNSVILLSRVPVPAAASFTIGPNIITEPFSTFELYIDVLSSTANNAEYQIALSKDGGATWTLGVAVSDVNLGAGDVWDAHITIANAAHLDSEARAIYAQSAVGANNPFSTMNYTNSIGGPINAIRLSTSLGSFDTGNVLMIGKH